MLPYSGCMPVLLCGLGLQASDSVLVSCLHSFTAPKSAFTGVGAILAIFLTDWQSGGRGWFVPLFLFQLCAGGGVFNAKSDGDLEVGPGSQKLDPGHPALLGFLNSAVP